MIVSMCRMSIYLSVRLYCLDVCLSANISQKLHIQTSPKFLCMSPLSVALPTLTTVQYNVLYTSGFVDSRREWLILTMHHKDEAKSDNYDCLVGHYKIFIVHHYPLAACIMLKAEKCSIVTVL